MLDPQEAPPRFKTGDVVYLKSGGHHMTVGATAGYPHGIECDWHDQNGTPHRADYRLEQLVLSPPPPPATQSQDRGIQSPINIPEPNTDWRDKHGLR